MKKHRQKSISLLICFLFLLTIHSSQLVQADTVDPYKSTDIQKFTSDTLEGTLPVSGDKNVKTIAVTNGTVQFKSITSKGSRFDILRSDNGGAYAKLTDFSLANLNFTDKYILQGHTYYYIIIAYDDKGNVIENLGPFKAGTQEVASASSKTIVLQIDNQYAVINGTKYTLSAKPVLIDGRAMVPLSFFSDVLGAQADWSKKDGKVTISLNGNTLVFTLGKSEAKLNNSTVYMDVPAIDRSGTAMIPVQFACGKLNIKIRFDNQAKQIIITGNLASQPKQPDKPQQTVTVESTLKDIVKSNKKYYGESKQGYTSTKYSITFNSFNEKTGEFKGIIDWTGFNVTDDISGKLDGDKLVYKQIARHQNNRVTKLDCTITLKLENYNRVSGTWNDALAKTTGTAWFEFTPAANSLAKFNTNYDSKGFPAGKSTLQYGDNFKFDGEVKVTSGNLIAIGTTSYKDGTKVIGRFVNGKPDGLSSIIYPNKKAYLVDFVYGKPVKYYAASTIPVYNSNELDVFKADEIDVFQADDIDFYQSSDIDFYQADDIDMYYAKDIEPYEAKMIELYQAQPVEKYESIATIDKYEAEIIKLNPPGAFNVDIPVGGYKTPDYSNPLVQLWTSHMMALPFLISGNMVYR